MWGVAVRELGDRVGAPKRRKNLLRPRAEEGLCPRPWCAMCARTGGEGPRLRDILGTGDEGVCRVSGRREVWGTGRIGS